MPEQFQIAKYSSTDTRIALVVVHFFHYFLNDVIILIINFTIDVYLIKIVKKTFERKIQQ